MYITRKEIRSIIKEVYKSGSKADMYNTYGITGKEFESIKSLYSSEDQEYRKMGNCMLDDLTSNKTLPLLNYEKVIVKDPKGKKINLKIQIPHELVESILEQYYSFEEEFKIFLKTRKLPDDLTGFWKLGNATKQYSEYIFDYIYEEKEELGYDIYDRLGVFGPDADIINLVLNNTL